MIELAAARHSPGSAIDTLIDARNGYFLERREEMPFEREFSGGDECAVVGGIRIAKVSAESYHTLRKARRDTCREVLLMFLTQGRATVAQRSSAVDMLAGDAVLLDGHEDFTIEQPDLISLTIAYLPAHELLSPIGRHRLPALRRQAGDDAMVSIVGRLLEGVLMGLPSFVREEGHWVRRILIESGRTLLARQQPSRSAMLERVPDVRIRDYIDAHLADPELDPARIAAACDISVRRVHRAFEDTSWTACSWIRKERLERCRTDLLDETLAHLSVTQIAFRWGFNDAAHFSRAFRDQFGSTPSQTRKGTETADVVLLPRYGRRRENQATPLLEGRR